MQMQAELWFLESTYGRKLEFRQSHRQQLFDLSLPSATDALARPVERTKPSRFQSENFQKSSRKGPAQRTCTQGGFAVFGAASLGLQEPVFYSTVVVLFFTISICQWNRLKPDSDSTEPLGTQSSVHGLSH